MGTQVRVCTALFLSASVLVAQGPTPLNLNDGTPIKIRLSRNLSSKTETTGNTVDFEVLEDIKAGDTIVISKGAVATGTITNAVKARRLGRAGKLDIVIDSVRTVANEKVALRAVRDSEGGSNAGKMTGAIVGTTILFFPAAPLFLLWKGKEYEVPKGTEITAYVNGDMQLDPITYLDSQFDEQVASVVDGQMTSSQAPAGAGNDEKPFTNEDVLALVNAGLTPEVVIAKINNSPADYHLETDTLISLKNASVPDVVIRAMIDAAGRQSRPQ
jgi:hypothetical protein